MSRVLMIVAQVGFRDEELLIPKTILERAGHIVSVASHTRARAVGVKGASVAPDLAFHEVNPTFFDMVVVVGGSGSYSLGDDQEVKRILVGASASGKILGAICVCPLALAKAGVVGNKNATCFDDNQVISMLRGGGATFVDKPLVVDDKLVTADGPQSAMEFGNALVQILKGGK